MYNKLFTKILDSSIWLAPDAQRLVWITFLAAMDQDGNAMFASAANVAARARVALEDARAAILAFESPDPDSGDPDNEGRRIERIPGGWHVLNAHKYREIATREQQREQTRERVRRHRDKKACNAGVTLGNAKSGQCNARVTPSEADTDANSALHLPVQEQPPCSVGEGVSGDASRKRSADQRGTRLPDDWQPSEEQLAWARLERADVDIAMEAESFADYWRAQPGQRGRKSDWPATWRNWIRKATARPTARIAQIRGRYGGAPTLPERMAAAADDRRASEARVVGNVLRAALPVTVMQALDHDD